MAFLVASLFFLLCFCFRPARFMRLRVKKHVLDLFGDFAFFIDVMLRIRANVLYVPRNPVTIHLTGHSVVLS